MSALPAVDRTEALVVVNRLARNAGVDLDAAIEKLSRRWCLNVLSITDPGSLPTRLEQALAVRRVACVVLAGGDGTLNSALPVLVRADRPFGIIPLGTANDFARSLEIPTEPESAAAVIARGRTRRIDVARVNDCLFVNAAGLGIGSDLQEEVTSRKKRVLGRLAYPLAVLKRGWANRSFHVSLSGCGPELDGRHRVVQITVANGRNYGGGMTAHEDATVDDGQFDILLIRAEPLWRYALHGMSLRRGVYAESSPMVAGRARSFELRTRRPKSISTDGEMRTRTPAVFTVVPRALEVFVP